MSEERPSSNEVDVGWEERETSEDRETTHRKLGEVVDVEFAIRTDEVYNTSLGDGRRVERISYLLDIRKLPDGTKARRHTLRSLIGLDAPGCFMSLSRAINKEPDAAVAEKEVRFVPNLDVQIVYTQQEGGSWIKQRLNLKAGLFSDDWRKEYEVSTAEARRLSRLIVNVDKPNKPPGSGGGRRKRLAVKPLVPRIIPDSAS